MILRVGPASFLPFFIFFPLESWSLPFNPGFTSADFQWKKSRKLFPRILLNGGFIHDICFSSSLLPYTKTPGVLCGCLLGMGNLFFLDLTKVERQKKQAESWTSCGRCPALGPIWIQCHISNHRRINSPAFPG